MKTICYIICVMGFISCNTIKDKQLADLILNEAIKQTWYGGQEGVQGKKYTMEISSKHKKNITFDSLFIKNHWYPVHVQGNNPWTLSSSITLPRVEQPLLDTVNSDGFRNADINVKIIKPNESPNDFQGKNVLRYRMDGENHYFIIDQFDSAESIAYP